MKGLGISLFEVYESREICHLGLSKAQRAEQMIFMAL